MWIKCLGPHRPCSVQLIHSIWTQLTQPDSTKLDLARLGLAQLGWVWAHVNWDWPDVESAQLSLTWPSTRCRPKVWAQLDLRKPEPVCLDSKRPNSTWPDLIRSILVLLRLNKPVSGRTWLGMGLAQFDWTWPCLDLAKHGFGLVQLNLGQG